MYSVYTDEQYHMCTVGLMIIHRVMIDGNPNVVLALYHEHVPNSCGFLWCLSNNTMSIRYHLCFYCYQVYHCSYCDTLGPIL